MHDVVDEVARLHGTASGSPWPPWSGPGAARLGSRGRRWRWPPDGDPIGQRQRRLRRGRGVRAGARGDGQRRAAAAALRRQRRRRVRRRADLRRHHRRLRRAGRRGHVPRAARRGGVRPGARAGRGRHRGRRARQHRRAPGRLAGPLGRLARHGAPRPGGARRRTRDARPRQHRPAAHRPGRRAPPGRAQRLRPVVRPAAPDAGVRRHRLRRGGRAGRQVPRLPGHRVRRPRSTFATAKRFPEADEVVVEWPHRYLPASRSTPAPSSAC